MVEKQERTFSYPFSQIVRDVMAIQVSTVACESAFSAAGRAVDPYRSHLDPEMVQTIICTKNWLLQQVKVLILHVFLVRHLWSQ